MIGSKPYTAILLLAGCVLANGTEPTAQAERRSVFADLVAATSPAVVTIATFEEASTPPGLATSPFPRNSGPASTLPPARQMGEGSGVIISDSGLIITNAHVIQDAASIIVDVPATSKSYEAKVLLESEEFDLAILQIDETNLPMMAIQETEDYRVGDEVLAIGNPRGLGISVSKGIISALNRDDEKHPNIRFIQTDAVIHAGSSGGPLVGMNGRLVGINTQILTTSGDGVGLGFAIPGPLVAKIVKQRLDLGELRPGMLGCELQALTPGLAASLGLPSETQGLFVAGVSEGASAAKSGIQPGDVIVSCDNEAVPSLKAFREQIYFTLPGTQLSLDVLRGGKIHTLTVDVVERGLVQSGRPLVGQLAGASVLPVSEELRAHFDLPASIKGGLVVVSVVPQSRAYRAGFRAGFVLASVRGKPVASLAEIYTYLKSNEWVPINVWTPTGIISTQI